MSVDFEHTWLPKAMARYGKTHLKIIVELRVDPNSVLGRAVARGELDIALLLESDGKPSPTRRSLRGVLQDIVGELLANRRSD